MHITEFYDCIKCAVTFKNIYKIENILWPFLVYNKFQEITLLYENGWQVLFTIQYSSKDVTAIGEFNMV